MVGILERGRLLAVGTVEEIQRQGRQPHNCVEVRLLDGTAALAEWLAARPGIERLAGQRRGRHASFMPATPRPRPPCCGPSIEAGFRVVAFGTQRQTLEDVFMQITQGVVQ